MSGAEGRRGPIDGGTTAGSAAEGRSGLIDDRIDPVSSTS
jgi:hypothetical protein